MNKIFITGAMGFIGTNLRKKLDDLNIPYQYNKHRQDLISHVSYFAPNILIHLAANPIVKTENFVDEQHLLETNIGITHRLLNIIPQYCHIILSSSATIYGENRQPVDETTIPKPQSIYGISKLTSEQLIQSYYTTKRIEGFSILRFIANVGPYANHGVLPTIIHKLKSIDKTLTLLGDEPGSIKPYIHVNDTIKAIIQCVQKKMIGIFNVGNQPPITIYNLAHIIMQTTQIHKPIQWMGLHSNWLGDDKYVHIDSSKLISHGWKIKYDTSEQAIIQGVRSYLQHS